MKLFRYMLAVAVAVAAAVVFAVSASAQTADFTLSVVPFADESTEINWWYSFSEDRYYLFLPADTDTSALEVRFSCDSLKINGKKVRSGKKTKILTPNAPLTVEGGGKEYPLTVLVSENLPAVFIHTESGSLSAVRADKAHKEAGSATVAENGRFAVKNAPLQYIKGRGNSTWDTWTDKKPYNIRFEEKVALFGMGAAKKWCLLANAFDQTLLRNSAAFAFSKTLSIPYAVVARQVDLYINGNYEGNYLLSESVQVGDGRVDIRDLEAENEDLNPSVSVDALPAGGTDGDPLAPGSRKWTQLPNEPADRTGGYLLEFDFRDRYAKEPAGFVSDRGQCVVIKSPEHASKAQVEYIAALYQEMEDAVYSETGYNAAGRHFSSYLDPDSFARMYLLLEFTMNFDGCSSSFFLTKDAGSGRFVAGPAWDYDLTFRNYRQAALDTALTPEVWAVRDNPMVLENGMVSECLIAALCRQTDFWTEVRRIWADVLPGLRNDIAQTVPDMQREIAGSACMNSVRWNLLDGATPAEKTASYADRCAVLLDLMETRLAALERGIPSPEALPSVSQTDLDEMRNTPQRSAEPSETSAVPASEPAEQEQPAPAASQKWLFVMLLALLCIAAAVVLCLFLRRRERMPGSDRKEIEKNGRE